MKTIVWMGTSLKCLREFPEIARQIAGRQLRRVQDGFQPSDWRPMASVGPGAIEIRIHRPHEHRVIYVAQFPEAIFVLHAFEKKNRKPPKSELDQARANYADIQAKREVLKAKNDEP